MFLRTLPLVAALLSPAAVAAESTAQPVPALAFPGDRVYVPLIGGGECNAARLDPARPPQIQLLRRFDNGSPHLDAYQYQVHYWLVNTPDIACGVPPPPPHLMTDVGELPLGLHTFDVFGYFGDQPHVSYSTGTSWVQQHDFLPPDLGGLWFDPAQTGRGVSVTRVSVEHAALLWFTHDAQGAPDWVASTLGKLSDVPRLRGEGFNTRGTPLASGSASLASQPWGSLEFDYLGCGRALLRWTPRDPRLPPGSQSLQKLAQDYGDAGCSVPGATQALWTNR